MISRKDRADAFKAGTLTLEPGDFVIRDDQSGEVVVFDAMLRSLLRSQAEQLRRGAWFLPAGAVRRGNLIASDGAGALSCSHGGVAIRAEPAAIVPPSGTCRVHGRMDMQQNERISAGFRGCP